MIVSLAKGSANLDKKIKLVQILGINTKVKWKQTAEGLIISKLANLPLSHATTIKVEFKK
ncbi:hypothetical protein [uncultured Arcticibacterium sp.]|uniref:hypothetical protein n=1 Tax=uncultured Arcticibacterium sp. TaxID=2173042 RepID=UPI0030FA9D53